MRKISTHDSRTSEFLQKISSRDSRTPLFFRKISLSTREHRYPFGKSQLTTVEHRHPFEKSQFTTVEHRYPFGKSQLTTREHTDLLDQTEKQRKEAKICKHHEPEYLTVTLHHFIPRYATASSLSRTKFEGSPDLRPASSRNSNRTVYKPL